MKVAVPTNDGISMSDHFGRSAAFIVFDVEDGKVAARSLRSNIACHTHQEHSCGESGDAQAHDHAAIIAAISDCQIVLCGGMGKRALDAVSARGISSVFVKGAGPAEVLVEAFCAGTLQPEKSSGCRCSH